MFNPFKQRSAAHSGVPASDPDTVEPTVTAEEPLQDMTVEPDWFRRDMDEEAPVPSWVAETADGLDGGLVDGPTAVAEPLATEANDSDADDSGAADEAAATLPVEKRSRLKRLFGRLGGRRDRRNVVVPIQVVIGFLPDVSRRDALEYALGIAEKHFQQAGLAFYDAFPHGGGYVYEVHEGGNGRAYVPCILDYFKTLGPFQAGESVTVDIHTSSRTVQVRRTREGLSAIILPERAEANQPDWLVAKEVMRPAVNKRTALLIAGAVLFVTGFMAAMTTSMLTRYQEWEPVPSPGVEKVSVDDLPLRQWPRLLAVPEGSYVKALRFRNGKWESPEITGTASVPSEAPAEETPAEDAPPPVQLVPSDVQPATPSN